MKIRSTILKMISVVLTTVIFTACMLPKYSFTGAVPMPGVKTFTVYDFPNRAKLVNPNLSQLVKDGLQEKMTRQTTYNQIRDNGDLEFSGQISEYDVKPMNIQSGDLASQNRLTIAVKVKYTNNKNHGEDWEETFRQYEDFNSNSSLDQVEDQLVPEIIKKLTEDIFNKSIANW